SSICSAAGAHGQPLTAFCAPDDDSAGVRYRVSIGADDATKLAGLDVDGRSRRLVNRWRRRYSQHGASRESITSLCSTSGSATHRRKSSTTFRARFERALLDSAAEHRFSGERELQGAKPCSP